jgi:hypothetical protein
MSLNINEETLKILSIGCQRMGLGLPGKMRSFSGRMYIKTKLNNYFETLKLILGNLISKELLLADFIRDDSNLEKWDVHIAQGSGSHFYPLNYGNQEILIQPESRTVKAAGSQICISGTKVRVGAGGATKIGLTEEQRNQSK